MNKVRFDHIRKTVIFWLLVVITFPIHVIVNGCVMTVSYLHDIVDGDFIDSFIK